jgi:hypothetical protein
MVDFTTAIIFQYVYFIPQKANNDVSSANSLDKL